MTDGGNRETGLGFYQQRRGQTRSCQIPSGRAAGSVANHPAGPGSSYRLVSDAIVRSLPESSPLIGWIASCLRLESNQYPRCFRPLLYHLSYRGVCRLVAETSQLVSRFDGIYIIFSLVVMGCDFHGFRYLDDGFTCVPHGRFNLCSNPGTLTRGTADRRLHSAPWDSNPQPKV